MTEILDGILNRTPLALSAAELPEGADVVLLFAAEADGTAHLLGSSLGEDAQAEVEALLADLGFTGAKDALVRLPKGTGGRESVTAVIGLGTLGTGATTQALRHAAGSAARALTAVSSLALDIAGDNALLGEAALEGAALGAYTFTLHKSAPKARVLSSLTWVAADVEAAERDAVIERVSVLVKNIELTRDLVNVSPLHLYPESFADLAVAAAEKAGVSATVLDDKELAAQGYGGLTAVGMGSSRGPRLVRLEYAPAKAERTAAFVGKGITFDTGGISLKPGPGMEQMKSDMAGAATVLSTVLAAAALKLEVRVIGYLAIAENMPSGEAGRPGDIITMFGGKTVEVLNTDAEGRLVMGDALVAASQDAPDALIDIATLTGAALVALGKRTAGIMGDSEVTEALFAASQATDETSWVMPIPEEMRGTLDSTQADIANIGQREGGMLAAAAFLQEFVGEVEGERIPWAHIDIAGPSFNDGGPYGHIAKEGTGFGIRMLVEYLRGLEK